MANNIPQALRKTIRRDGKFLSANNLLDRFGSREKIISVVALAAITVVYSFYHGYKRYKGLGHEDVIEMAVLGKQLSEGKGFSTLVVYPQAVAVLESKHDDYIFKENQLHPKLYQAPFYPLILATGLKVME